MANNKAEVIRKTFDEVITEIKGYEQNLTEIVPRPPSGEGGGAIETLTMSYGEALAEIERVELIKRLAVKGRKEYK